MRLKRNRCSSVALISHFCSELARPVLTLAKWLEPDLQPLVSVLGNHVIDLFVGKVRRTYEAHLELNWSRRQNPSSIIMRFCRLIESPPHKKRKISNAAKIRSFDVGIAAPGRNYHFWHRLSSDAVRSAAEIGAQIAITVYGPMKTVRAKKRR